MQAFAADFKSTLTELRGSRVSWRSLRRKALPLAAAAALASGALWARKQSCAPDAELLNRRARFECAPASVLAGRGSLPAPAVVEKSIRLGGAGDAEVAALRRAAQRLRGPIELDLLIAEGTCVAAEAAGEGDSVRRRQDLYRALVQRWREAGYLKEPEEHQKPRDALGGVDYVTQTDESYGRDVGCLVPLMLAREPKSSADPFSLGMAETEAAVRALEEHGVVLLKSIMGHAEIQALRERLHLQISALDRGRKGSAFPPVREYDAALLQADEPDLEAVQSTPGRRHFYLRGRALEDAVTGVQAGAVPLVWAHLARAAEAAGLPAGTRLYVSEVQLLVTDPCAVDQFWHVDNTAPGLTLFVPLTDVPQELGPTLFLPGSHRLLAEVPGSPGIVSRVGSFFSAFFGNDGVVVGSMAAGDALIYDARLVHRGAANRKYDRARVALVFRYDFDRPPGVGILGTQLFSWTGNTLAVIQRFYASLPGPARAATP